MKNKKFLIVNLILLAIFIIGAASASEDIASDDSALSVSDDGISEDTLTVSDEVTAIEDVPVGDEPLSTDADDSSQSSADEVILDEDNNQGIIIFVDEKSSFPTSGEDVDDGFAAISAPKDMGGSVIISSNGKQFFNKAFSNFDENKVMPEDDEGLQNYLRYSVSPLDVGFFEGLSNGNVIDIAVLNSGNTILDSKKYSIFFEGNSFRFVSISNDEDSVTKIATKITAPKVSTTYNVAKKLVVTLKDANGKILANKKVTIKVGTISKTLKTNTYGKVAVAIGKLVPKTYTASIKFAGDSNYKASSFSVKVVVNKAKPKITAKKKTFKATAKTKKVTAILKNNKGKILKKVKLTLKIGKKIYSAKTNSKGVATFKVKLTKKGKYTGKVKFAGSKYYKAVTKNVYITVKK
jgi:hypothetical protein